MGCSGSKVEDAPPPPQGNQKGQQQVQQNQRVNQRGNKRGNQKGQQDETKQHERRDISSFKEQGWKRRIRENLRRSTDGDDLDILQKDIETFKKNKMENGGDLDAAEEREDYLSTRKEIRDACMREHPKVLEDAIARVEASKYSRQLKPYTDKARHLLKNQEDQKMFKHKVSGLDQTTVSEVRSYKIPPVGGLSTMTSVYMLCGYEEKYLQASSSKSKRDFEQYDPENIRDWNVLTGLMGRIGNRSLLHEMHEAEGKPVDKDVALRVSQHLGGTSLDRIREESNSLATFYQWSSVMIGKQGNSNNQRKTPSTPTRGRQQPGQKTDSNKPKTPSEPSTAKRDNKQAVTNTQTAKNAQQTGQQANSVANKTTRKV